MDLVKHNNLPEPSVGYDLSDSDSRFLLELELAWESQQVGIVVYEEDEEDDFWHPVQSAQKLGWNIFTVYELEDELQRFLNCFHQKEGN